MTLLSTSSHLIKVGQEYSAGHGISIDDHVISVTGGTGNTYSAGDNISIYEQDEQLYISSKDWTNDIANASANAYNAATAQIPEPQDLSYISSKVDDKLDSTAFTNWQTGQYTTDIQTIEGQITNKLDTSSFGEVSASFLTAINIPESATWNDVSTTVQTNSAQWAEGGSGDEEVNSFVYNNSATINEVNTTYQTHSASYLTAHQDISNKLDTTAFSTVSGDFLTAAPADMATTGDIAELAQTVSETYQTKGDYLVRSDSANFYPANNPSGFITGVNLSNYYTKDETSGKEELANAFANIPVGDPEVNAYVTDNSATLNGTKSLVQSNSSTWNDITAYQSNSANYLTSVNIPESATWNEVSTTVQSNSAQWAEGGTTYTSPSGTILIDGDKLEGTTSALGKTVKTVNVTPNNAYFSAIQGYPFDRYILNRDVDKGGYAVILYGTWGYGFSVTIDNNFENPIEIPLTYSGFNLSTYNGYYSKISAVKPGVVELALKSDLEQVSADITETIPSTAGLASESYVQTNSAVLTGMIDGKQDTLSFGYDNTNKISAINGSAIAAGGDEFPVSADEAIQYVQSNSATIDDTVTSYQINSGTFLTAHQAISAEEWNDCYNNVNTNSGAWGGSALPISAGPGVKLQLIDNTLVVRTILSAGQGINVTTSNNSLAVSTVPSAFYTLNISNIILTASLPGTPDANTLYLIQE